MLNIQCFFFTTSCRKAVNINPRKDAEVFVNVDDNYADSGLFLFALSCTIHCVDLLTHSSSSGPWRLLRPARRSCHPSQSEADVAAAPHVCYPSLFLSFSKVLLHVSLGRPHLLFPSGAHINAVLEMLLGLFLNTCPNHHCLLTCIRTDTGELPVASYSSSLLKWLGQNCIDLTERYMLWWLFIMNNKAANNSLIPD